MKPIILAILTASLIYSCGDSKSVDESAEDKKEFVPEDKADSTGDLPKENNIIMFKGNASIEITGDFSNIENGKGTAIVFIDLKEVKKENISIKDGKLTAKVKNIQHGGQISFSASIKGVGGNYSVNCFYNGHVLNGDSPLKTTLGSNNQSTIDTTFTF